MHTFIDTHAHLYLAQFDEDRDAAIDSALQEGVKKILLPNIDKSTIGQMLDTENKICWYLLCDDGSAPVFCRC